MMLEERAIVMKKYELNLFVLMVFVSAAILIVGCESVPKTPRTAVYNLKINSNSSSKITKDDVTIKINPITIFNYKGFPEIYETLKYSTYENTWTFPLIFPNLPAFELMITNNTNHVIRFNRVVIKLQDNNGQMIDSNVKKDLINNVNLIIKSYQAREIDIDTSLVPVLSKIEKIDIIDENFELLPDMTQKAYLTFNIPKESLQTKQYLKVILYDVPVKMDEAGNIAKATKFEFIFDISSGKKQIKKTKKEKEIAKKQVELQKQKDEEVRKQQQVKEIAKSGFKTPEDRQKYLYKYWAALKKKDLIMIKNTVVYSLMDKPEILKQEGFYFLGDVALIEKDVIKTKEDYLKGFTIGGFDKEGLMYHLIQFGEMYPDLKPIINGIYVEITKGK